MENAHAHAADDAIKQDTLWTIGHSTRSWDMFLDLLQEARVETLVDVRRHAGSRRNPQFSLVAMAPALREAGIDYVPMPAFGGRRSADKDSLNAAWRVAAFRGYADYMAMPEFVLARERLMQLARSRRTAVMCAEALWWQCHRRLIADDFTARDWQVLHLMTRERCERHPLNEAAQMIDGVLRYPAQSLNQTGLF